MTPETAKLGSKASVTGSNENGDDWKSSPQQILTRLEATSIAEDELLQAVLFAEIAEFDEQQTKRLLPCLLTFVRKRRLSHDARTMTAAGSAIRKLAMNLPEAAFESFAELFEPTATDALPCEIELELAKALVWRLAANPPTDHWQLPILKERLADLAMDYLRPRLILQKNYASIVLHAALGLALLDGDDADRVLGRIQDMKIDWFSELFLRRFRRLQAKLVEHGDRRASAITERLSRFESQMQACS